MEGDERDNEVLTGDEGMYPYRSKRTRFFLHIFYIFLHFLKVHKTFINHKYQP